MLKMGQMCHCKATLWKIDPSTGEIQWAADRGVSTSALAAYDDGSNVYIYEAGAVSGVNRATQWRDDTDFATRMWGAALSGTPTLAEMGDDGKVWVQNTFRLNAADGTTANSATLSNSPFSQMKYAPSSGMYIVDGSNNLELSDTSVSITATVSSTRPWCVRLASSWFACLTTSPTRFMRTYDDSLVQTNSANQPLVTGTNILSACHRESTGKVFCVETNGGTPVNWRQIDVAGLTANWTISPLSSYVDGFPAALEADGDMYVAANKQVSDSAAGAIIARLSGVDGSTVWSKTYSAPSSAASGTLGLGYELIRWDDLLIGVLWNSSGGGRIAIGPTTADCALFALDYATGDTVWSRSLEGVGVFSSRPRVINDMLYVAGARGKRAVVPDLVHL